MVKEKVLVFSFFRIVFVVFVILIGFISFLFELRVSRCVLERGGGILWCRWDV